MSRTIRRKGFNYKGNRNSFDHEAEKDLKRSARWAEFWEQQTGRTVVKSNRRWDNPNWCEWRYHADRGKYRSIPHWFCVLRYYAPERAAMRAVLQGFKRCEDWEDVDVHTDIHTDLWNDWC